MTQDKIKMTLAPAIELAKLTEELLADEHYSAATIAVKRMNALLTEGVDELLRLAEAEKLQAAGPKVLGPPTTAKDAATMAYVQAAPQPAPAAKVEAPREAVPAPQAPAPQAG